jgi:hypothetical protein
MDIPELVPELVEFLRTRGYDVVPQSDDEISVTGRDPQDFGAAMTLLADLDVWRAKHPWAIARLDPQLTT